MLHPTQIWLSPTICRTKEDTWKNCLSAARCANQRLWYLGESIKMMAEADAFIGIYDRDKEFDGCIVENYTAKTYDVPQYLVDVAYVAPDIAEKRMKRFV